MKERAPVTPASLHLLERGAPSSRRIGDRLDDLEVIVAVGDQKLHRLARPAPHATKSRVWRWNSGVSGAEAG